MNRVLQSTLLTLSLMLVLTASQAFSQITITSRESSYDLDIQANANDDSQSDSAAESLTDLTGGFSDSPSLLITAHGFEDDKSADAQAEIFGDISHNVTLTDSDNVLNVYISNTLNSTTSVNDPDFLGSNASADSNVSLVLEFAVPLQGAVFDLDATLITGGFGMQLSLQLLGPSGQVFQYDPNDLPTLTGEILTAGDYTLEAIMWGTLTADPNHPEANNGAMVRYDSGDIEANFTVTSNSIPEPATAVLLALGAFSLSQRRRANV